MLAGEEGFEPPYPVLETGVLTVGRLPFTLSLPSRRRVYPFAQRKPLNLLFPAPALNFFLSSPRCFTASTAFLPNQFDRPAFCGVIGSNAPIVPLNPIFYVDRNPYVERVIATSNHVTEPNCFRLRHVSCYLGSGFRARALTLHSVQGKPLDDSPKTKTSSAVSRSSRPKLQLNRSYFTSL
jgi:hypothetical protein